MTLAISQNSRPLGCFLGERMGKKKYMFFLDLIMLVRNVQCCVCFFFPFLLILPPPSFFKYSLSASDTKREVLCFHLQNFFSDHSPKKFLRLWLKLLVLPWIYQFILYCHCFCQIYTFRKRLFKENFCSDSTLNCLLLLFGQRH